jgi:hypothetical protein
MSGLQEISNRFRNPFGRKKTSQDGKSYRVQKKVIFLDDFAFWEISQVFANDLPPGFGL